MAFTTFKGWIASQLSDDLINRDSYKNGDDHGIYERFTWNIDHEIDEEVYPFIRDVQDIFDPMKMPAKLINHMAFTLGRIPLLQNDTFDRRLIQWSNRLFQVKGTLLSYQMICHLLGLRLVSLTEEEGTRGARYDDDLTEYDSEDEADHYDVDCSRCIEYTLVVDFGDTDMGIMSTYLRQLICLIQPIDTKYNLESSEGVFLVAEIGSDDPADPSYTPLLSEETGDNLIAEA